jgi:single-strand DNA-binding protein
MASLNKAQLIGRLTRDVDLRFTPQGQAVANFSIATNRYGAADQEGGRKEYADFHNCVAWNQGKFLLAERVAQHCQKGALVYVEGRLQTRSWDDRDGTKRYTTEVVADNVQFLAAVRRKEEEGQG